MKKLLLIATIAIAIVSCDKNQKSVKTLDGNWNVTSIKFTEDGVSEEFLEPGSTFKLSFDGCKLEDDEYCVMTSTSSYGGMSETESSVYRVTGEGTKLEIKDSLTSSTSEIIEIVELDKENLKLKQVDGTETKEITAKKQ